MLQGVSRGERPALPAHCYPVPPVRSKRAHITPIAGREASGRRLALALVSAAAFGCAREPEEGAASASEARSALLVTLDTTRADALGWHWDGDSVTPHLDELAREGMVFERAYTSAPITLPSHASMLTGLYPPRTGVRNNGLRPLPQSAETLAERARAAGIQTAAFVGAVVLDPAFGLAQGFEHYDVPASRPGGASSHFDERPAGEVVDAALAWLRTRDRERPFFLWLHLFDPHAPYAPPPAFRDERFGNAYYGEVAYADAELGRLLGELRSEGALASTTVLVVADHGEAFGEHGELSHATYCYEPTLHVPLLLRRHDRAGAGTRRGELASVADVHPTLSDALGLEALDGLDGKSLFHLRPPEERGLYFESYYAWQAYGWSPLAGWLDEDGKYLHSARPQFFDLRADPAEERDLAGERDLRASRDAIAKLFELPALALAEANGIDAELVQRIQALGYAGVGDAQAEVPHPLAPSDRPSPASRANEHRALMLAVLAANEQRWADAEELCEQVLVADPSNPAALEQVATARIEQGDFAGAIAPLQTLLRGEDGRANLLYNLAISYWQVGRLDEAAEVLRRVARLAPREPRVLAALAQVLRLTQQELEAEAIERDLRELEVEAAGGRR